MKRVLKNKRLIRNFLLIFGLLFIGFFLWITFFGKKRILEGNSNAALHTIMARSLASARCPAVRPIDAKFACELKISLCDQEENLDIKNDCYNNIGHQEPCPKSGPGQIGNT